MQNISDFKADYRAEQQLYAPDINQAEANLVAITRIMQAQASFMKTIKECFPSLRIGLAHHCIEETLAELLAGHWYENKEICHSIAYPEHVPSFVKEGL